MRVCLAGAESKGTIETLVKVAVPNALMSYFYMKKMKDKGVDSLQQAKAAGMWVLVDSGAHTFFAAYPWLDPRGAHATAFTEEQIEEKKEEFLRTHDSLEDALGDIDRYVADYMVWCKDMEDRGLLDAYAELDIDSLVGLDKVWEWRHAWKKAGLKPIITPHSGGADEIKKIIDYGYFDYLGLAGGGRLTFYTDFFTDYREYLESNKIKVHGWAQTNLTSIRKLPFYSIDSSSWLMGCQYGVTYEYIPGSFKMKSHDSSQKERRKKWKQACIENDIDFDELLADKGRTVNEWNALQWKLLSKDMMENTINAYWLTDEEKAEIQLSVADEFKTSTAIQRIDPKQRVPIKYDRRLEMGRYCNTCFLGGKCPNFEPDSTCNISILPEIEKGEDLLDVLKTMLSIQSDRVMMATFMEKVQGGYVDGNVSKEISMLMGMAKDFKDIIDNRDEVVIKAKGAGVISKIFGLKE